MKFPEKCLYHLPKSHSTKDCHVKKECDRLCSSKNPSGSTSASTGQLHHLTVDNFEDAVATDDSVDLADSIPNDTNNTDLLYFACEMNHCLHLVRKIPGKALNTPCHPINFPIIDESGSIFHMFF